MPKKTNSQKFKDFVFFPIRTLLPEKYVEKIGLTTLKKERINIVLNHCQGKVLDIGCGNNELIKEYKNGIGIDAYPWENADIICDTINLPFENQSFDTVTFVASLNHIPNRLEVLKEANRVLKNNGKFIITMINPTIGFLCHSFFWIDEDLKKRKKMKSGEKYGLSEKEILNLFDKSGVKLTSHIPFVYNLNHLYIARKI
jgi:ubiquinone/menaquinone biosynthesis C-methylase UbiE